MKNGKLYTATDFANYHAGTMPAKDMHALEKAALEDPFLADALDGYLHTKTAVADIESLKEKFTTEEKVETKVLSFSSNKAWMRAAASIAIILGLGYLFYNVNKKDEVTAIAKNEIKQELKIDSANIQLNKIDSENNAVAINGSKESSAALDAKPHFDSGSKQFVDDKVSTIPSAVTTAQAPTAPTITRSEETLESEVAKTVRRDSNTDYAKNKEQYKDLGLNSRTQNNAMNYYNYSGVVQTATGGPMQNATIRSRNSNIATQTDTKGRFNFRSTDSVTNVSIAAVGYDKKEAILNSNASQILRLDNKSTNLSEVVVTGMGTKRKSATVGYSNTTVEKALAGKVSGVKVSNNGDEKNISLKKTKAIEIDSVRFNIEKKSFNDYVKQNIKPEFDDNGNEYKGSVILSFITNKKGKPTKIKVEQSLNNVCDEQAITLLQQGPKWIKNLEERKRVEIVF